MAEYIKREDAINGIKNHLARMRTKNEIYTMAHRHLIEVIEIIPAADVVEVVRCRNCRYYDLAANFCELYRVQHHEMFFCKDGWKETNEGEPLPPHSAHGEVLDH